MNSFYYLTSREIPENILVGSIAISYIFKTIFSIIINIQSWSIRAAILCTAALTFSILCVVITESKVFNKCFRLINHKSAHNDIFTDVIDYKNGTCLRAVCDDGIYIGNLLFYEENGKDSWIVLTDYSIESENENRDFDDVSYPSVIMVRLSDIKHIELYYNKENTVL